MDTVYTWTLESEGRVLRPSINEKYAQQVVNQFVLHHNCHGSMVTMLQISYCMAAQSTWKVLACDIKASYEGLYSPHV